MPSPKEAAQRLVDLAALAEQHIAGLRLILPKLDRAEADMRLVLVQNGLPVNDHIAHRARISETARRMIDADPGFTLAEAVTRAFADELKGV